MSAPYPRRFSHIGLSVPDVEAAVKFYRDVMGWYIIMEPSEIVEDDSAIGEMCTDVFGKGWKSFKIAHLSTSDGIGVELFEFAQNESQRTTSNTGRPASSITVFRTLMWKVSQTRLRPQVVSAA